MVPQGDRSGPALPAADGAGNPGGPARRLPHAKRNPEHEQPVRPCRLPDVPLQRCSGRGFDTGWRRAAVAGRSRIRLPAAENRLSLRSDLPGDRTAAVERPARLSPLRLPTRSRRGWESATSPSNPRTFTWAASGSSASETRRAAGGSGAACTHGPADRT